LRFGITLRSASARKIMDEHVHRQYLKEEEFLEMYYGLVDAVLPQIDEVWQPNYGCNDQARQHRDLLLATDRLAQLTFDSAVIFHGRQGLSSIRLYLRSSARLLIVRIKWVEGETRVEVLANLARQSPTCGRLVGSNEPDIRRRAL
jgi:hypothetical protein